MKLLTVNELSQILNCKPSFVYRLVHERRINFIKLGHRQLRFNAETVESWLQEKESERAESESV